MLTQAHVRALRDNPSATVRADIAAAVGAELAASALTPAEAEAMQELVRKLFKDKLNNLKNQFTHAYQENNAPEALITAARILAAHGTVELPEG